ncbi:MAG: hypothetical protein RSC73_00270 [Ruthenibacterium sp.]
MTQETKIEILKRFGAQEADMAALLAYVENAFVMAPPPDTNFSQNSAMLLRWKEIVQQSTQDVEAALRRYLAQTAPLHLLAPTQTRVELYASFAGVLPIIYTQNTADFETLVTQIVYKGKKVDNIAQMGAMFAFGKNNRFIILSNKPYSNVPAQEMCMDDAAWRAASMILRREHECTHYYTKSIFNTSNNNLHDEMIADFNGIYTALGFYKAEYFVRFWQERFPLYTKNLTENQVKVINAIAFAEAAVLEKWSKSAQFLQMGVQDRICFLCKNSLLQLLQMA